MSTVPKITIEQAKIICANPANADLWMANQNQMIGAYNKALAEQQGNEGSAWYTPTSFIDKQKLRESQQEGEYITAAQARGKFKDGYLEVLCENGETIKYPAIKPPLQESEYITAAQAQHLGFGKVQVRQIGEKYWQGVTAGFYYSPQFEYRAIKQAQPEPLDKHAALRAEYIRQRDAVPCELGFYLWETLCLDGATWDNINDCLGEFFANCQYRYKDISCHVSKDGEPAIRMLRTDAQELQRNLGDTVDWFMPEPNKVGAGLKIAFTLQGTYTYRTKATIKLDGKMVTPEQAAAEWDAKKETHDVWIKNDVSGVWFETQLQPRLTTPYSQNNNEYQLRPKQPTWTGSREDVIALLKEMGVL